jgi:uncharacterized membrane protein
MSITNRQWTLASLVVAVLLAALFVFGGHYRAILVLFLPLGFWLSLRREPEQTQTRPGIRALGWVFVCFSILVLIASLITIAAGR